ncbi:MAG: DnaJ domain-containing protein, partial [Thermoleophilia bacterium]|nr:DnaJ domain-containing protein [Thermoleophilia bacterium]
RRAEEAYRRAKAEARSGPDREDAGAHERQRCTKTLPDYYEVLEVSPRARQSVIDKAYRALMREDHPDQGGDVAGAQLINEAYEILGDPSRRAAYDREMGLA